MATTAQITEELKRLNALILDLLNRVVVRGSWNGREYTTQDLSKLYALRDRLEAQLARIDSGGMRSRTIVPRG